MTSPLRVVVVTGIFPPDIGGPATHAGDLLEMLGARGHEVHVLTLADGGAEDSEHVTRLRRDRNPALRLVALVAWLRRHRGRYDVVYSTGLRFESALGAWLARRPLVLKVVTDDAWERARRLGWTSLDFPEFHASNGGPLRVRGLRWMQRWAVRRARTVVTPSDFLAGVVRDWVPGTVPVVVRNGVRLQEPAPAGARGSTSLRVLFVGRLVHRKRVDIAIRAVAATPGTTLTIVGTGPELEVARPLVTSLGAGDRVRFLGSLSHDAVLREMAEGDVLTIPSDMEGFPHTALEALAAGLPLLARPIGGLERILVHDVTGLVVDDDDPAAFAAHLRRLVAEPDLLGRLSGAAREMAEGYSFDRTTDGVERALREAVGPWARRPVGVWVGKGAVSGVDPARPRNRLAVIGREFRATVIADAPAATREMAGTRVVPFPAARLGPAGSALYYALAPALATVVAARRGPSVVVCQSPYEAVVAAAVGRLLPRALRPLLVVEVHGDWRTATRLYGSSLRRLLAAPADAAARWSLRRADRVRVIGRFTGDLVDEAGYRGPVDVFPTHTEIDLFLAQPRRPLRGRPTACYAGSFERTKGIDVLLEAWPKVRAEVPDARLLVVGDGALGPLVAAAADDPSVEVVGRVERTELPAAFDRSWLVVVPSRSEGLGRVVLEAQGRGRAVVASDVGGLPELVDSSTGRLAPAEDPAALARAVAELLGDRARCDDLGVAARRAAEQRDPTGAFEEGVRRLAATVAASAGSAR